MAFPTALAARLSGATPSQITYWRTEKLLVPETEHEQSPFLYSFRDVVMLRAFAWLREDHSLQQVRRSLANAEIMQVVSHPSEYRFVKAGSSIGIEIHDGVVDVAEHPGQQVVGTMSDVLGEFVTRQKRRVRPLASPHDSIEVELGRLGGWPTIEGTRIPFDVIAALLEDGSLSPEQVALYYPSVTPAAAADALAFSREVTGRQATAAQ